jgi:hypothetical protein
LLFSIQFMAGNWNKPELMSPASLSAPSGRMATGQSTGLGRMQYAKPKREAPGLLSKRSRPAATSLGGGSKSKSSSLAG